MITKKIWELFIDYKIGGYESNSFHIITPEDKAISLIACSLLTLFTIVLDIICSPLEIIYCLLVKYYENQEKEYERK